MSQCVTANLGKTVFASWQATRHTEFSVCPELDLGMRSPDL
jgi:hypothetical protein